MITETCFNYSIIDEPILGVRYVLEIIYTAQLSCRDWRTLSTASVCPQLGAVEQVRPGE